MVPQLRFTSPAPEVEYFLDCAQEVVEIDACSAMTLRLYGDDEELLPLVTQRFRGYKERVHHCLELAVIADRILATLPSARRSGLIHIGLRNVIYEIESMAEVFSGWAIEDEISGGCLLPFRVHQRQRKGIPFKRTWRRLHSPSFIRRYARHHILEIDYFKALADIMIERASRLGELSQPDPTITVAWRSQLACRDRGILRRSRQQNRAARKMIRRSLNQAIAIVGQGAVSSFLRGEEIKLIGSESILAVRKRGRLSDVGEGCLSVALLSREGARLADLCTFIEKTPTLDQLSAFALWMAVGEDRSVIRAANIIHIEDGIIDHPLLDRDRRRRRDDLVARLVAEVGQEQATRILGIITSDRRGVRFVRQLSYDEERRRNNDYWLKTKSYWVEAMTNAIIGRRNLPLFWGLLVR